MYADEHNYAMCCSIVSSADADTDKARVKAKGLVDDHAYSLIATKQIKL